jgi:hypothetical protein
MSTLADFSYLYFNADSGHYTPLFNNPGFLPSQLDAGKSNTFNQREARVQMEDSENTDSDWSQSVKNLFEKG